MGRERTVPIHKMCEKPPRRASVSLWCDKSGPYFLWERARTDAATPYDGTGGLFEGAAEGRLLLAFEFPVVYSFTDGRPPTKGDLAGTFRPV